MLEGSGMKLTRARKWTFLTAQLPAGILRVSVCVPITGLEAGVIFIFFK